MSDACMFFMSGIVFVYVCMFILKREREVVDNTYLTVNVLAS